MEPNVIIPKPVLKIINSLSEKDRNKIILKLQVLENDPQPLGSTKLHGIKDQYRIRSEDFRIRYLINQDKDIVVLDIANRREIYKKKK